MSRPYVQFYLHGEAGYGGCVDVWMCGCVFLCVWVVHCVCGAVAVCWRFWDDIGKLLLRERSVLAVVALQSTELLYATQPSS